MAARKFRGEPTKSDFVRSMGDMKASDIVAAAKKKGIKLSERYVYVIRSSDNAKARKSGGRPIGGRRRGGRRNGDAEVQLRRAIAELGLVAARQILRDVEAAFSR